MDNNEIINIIDTNIMSSNIVANANNALSSYEEQIFCKLLESQSYAVQMACKTHGDTIEADAKQKNSFKQKEFENIASQNIKLLGSHNAKALRYAVTFSALTGLLIGTVLAFFIMK